LHPLFISLPAPLPLTCPSAPQMIAPRSLPASGPPCRPQQSRQSPRLSHLAPRTSQLFHSFHLPYKHNCVLPFRPRIIFLDSHVTTATFHSAPQVVLNVSTGVYAQRASERAAAARAARAAAASAPHADSLSSHNALPLPPVDMFSDAPLPAFVGPARGAAAVGSMYDEAPAAAAAPASAAAMPPPRTVTKPKDTKFIGFGGISAAYDDVYVGVCLSLTRVHFHAHGCTQPLNRSLLVHHACVGMITTARVGASCSRKNRAWGALAARMTGDV
jgi:hypothetical protein